MSRVLRTDNHIAPLLLAIGLLLPGCTVQPWQTLDQSQPLELRILHTNDMHSHIAGIDNYGNACVADADCRGGMARIARAIRQAKERQDNVLALDAGDQFQGTLFFSVHKWPMLSEIDKCVPYDAMTLGNHEFDEGCQELTHFLEKVPFAVLAANLAAEDGCPLRQSASVPYVIRAIRGVPVGIVGIANDEIQLSAACKHTRFTDTVDTVRRVVAKLQRQGVRHVVLITHIGLPRDRELARTVDGVDVIVGGHTHSYLGSGSDEGPYPVVERSPSGQPVLVVTAGSATRYLGDLTVRFDTQGVPVSWHGAAREIAVTDSRDAAVSDLVETYGNALAAYRQALIGRNEVRYPDGMDACRKDDCLGGIVTAEAMLEYARPFGAHAAIYNGGGIRAAFPRGAVSRGDILSMHPFGTRVVIQEYTGEQIWNALENGVSGEHAQGPRLLHTAGLRYVVDASRPKGRRVTRVELVDKQNGTHPLDVKARYVVALTEYLSHGGDGYSMLEHGRTIALPDVLEVEIVETYLRQYTPLRGPVQERIMHTETVQTGVDLH